MCSASSANKQCPGSNWVVVAMGGRAWGYVALFLLQLIAMAMDIAALLMARVTCAQDRFLMLWLLVVGSAQLTLHFLLASWCVVWLMRMYSDKTGDLPSHRYLRISVYVAVCLLSACQIMWFSIGMLALRQAADCSRSTRYFVRIYFAQVVVGAAAFVSYLLRLRMMMD